MASGRTLSGVGFIVTNMARHAENVIAFYNKRGTCEEGKGAIKWTRLSCRSFAADQRGLLALALERVNRWRRAIEHRNRVAPSLAVAIHVGPDRTEKAVRLSANLVRGAVINTQGARTPPYIDAQGLP
jgi:hypothetical protein